MDRIQDTGMVNTCCIQLWLIKILLAILILLSLVPIVNGYKIKTAIDENRQLISDFQSFVDVNGLYIKNNLEAIRNITETLDLEKKERAEVRTQIETIQRKLDQFGEELSRLNAQ